MTSSFIKKLNEYYYFKHKKFCIGLLPLLEYQSKQKASATVVATGLAITVVLNFIYLSVLNQPAY